MDGSVPDLAGIDLHLDAFERSGTSRLWPDGPWARPHVDAQDEALVPWIGVAHVAVASEGGHMDLPLAGVDLRTLLAQLEDRLIGQALARTGGNKNRAAELLGMNRTTLVEKLRRRNVA